jgi:hypothetical protein
MRKGMDFEGDRVHMSATEIPSPYHGKIFSIGISILSVVVRAARKQVPGLLVFLFQLVLINFIVFGMVSLFMGAILGLFSLLLVFPLSLAISRLVGRDRVLSIVIGGSVVALVEGGLGYYVRDWSARYGALYGAFYGISLTSYFSIEDRHTNYFWAVSTTCLLITILAILECSNPNCLEFMSKHIGNALAGAVSTIIFGLLLAPIITIITNYMEAYIEQFTDLGRDIKRK